MEIKCRVDLGWADKDTFFFLKKFIDDNYSFEERGVDDSEALLKQIEGMNCVHIQEVESDGDLELSDSEEMN